MHKIGLKIQKVACFNQIVYYSSFILSYYNTHVSDHRSSGGGVYGESSSDALGSKFKPHSIYEYGFSITMP